MYTKSLIQQRAEICEAKYLFDSQLSNIMEKYNIEDSIFVFNGKSYQELENGYFEINEEYDNLEEAIDNMNLNTMGVRIQDNCRFQIGTIKRSIFECENREDVLDIQKLINI